MQVPPYKPETSPRKPSRKELWFFYRDLYKQVLDWEAHPLAGGEVMKTKGTMRKGQAGPVLEGKDAVGSIQFMEFGLLGLERTETPTTLSYSFIHLDSPYRHILTRPWTPK